MSWGGEGRAPLYLLTFSGMPNIFTFCSGSRSTKDGVECSAHCGGAVEEDLPSANQMRELKVVVRGN